MVATAQNASMRYRSRSSAPFPGVDHEPRRDGQHRRGPSRQALKAQLAPSFCDISALPKHCWDVDMWRRGKIARQGQPTFDAAVESSSLFAFSSAHTTASLPSTSAAFNFFPAKRALKRVALRRSAMKRRDSYPDGRSENDSELASQPEKDGHTDRQRSDAFDALHRSVAASGEGLIMRMREWEARNAQEPRTASLDLLRGRTSPEGVGALHEPDAMDICGEAMPLSPTSCKRRALSLDDAARTPNHGAMTTRGPTWAIPSSLSSPAGTPAESGATFDDDDDDVEFELDLSDSASTSARSTGSLPSPSHSVLASAGPYPTVLPSCAAPSDGNGFAPASLSATRSEKAIAALTLALENGAGAIHDYGIPSESMGAATIMDQELVGDMWH